MKLILLLVVYLIKHGCRKRKIASKKPVSANESNSSMKDLLECPVCMTLMYPPIYQCCNGHTLCSKCKPKVRNSCPICREGLGDIRCLALEKVAEKLDLPCKFHTCGCESVFSHEDRLKHEEVCTFRPYNCPFVAINCAVTGDIASLVAHLKEVHRVPVHDGPNFMVPYILRDNIPTGDYKLNPYLISYDSQYFCMHAEGFWMGNAALRVISLRFMGEESDAKKFRYCLEVSWMGRGKTMVFIGNPGSIRDSKIVRNSLDGVIIPMDLASGFSADGQGSQLRVKLQIWKS